MPNFKPIMKAGTLMDLDKTRNDIRYTRAKLGVSVLTLSKLSGISVSHITNIELGKRNFTSSTANKLYAALRQFNKDKEAGLIPDEKPIVYPEFLD